MPSMRKSNQLDATNSLIRAATKETPRGEAISEAHSRAARSSEICLECEVAWGDVHDKIIDLAKVKEARGAAVDDLRQTQAFVTMSLTKMARHDGKDAFDRTVDRHEQAGRAQSEVPQSTVAQAIQEVSMPSAVHCDSAN